MTGYLQRQYIMHIPYIHSTASVKSKHPSLHSLATAATSPTGTVSLSLSEYNYNVPYGDLKCETMMLVNRRESSEESSLRSWCPQD
jgi:hypothetical protein